MLAAQITQLKPFMNAMLAGDLFDVFLLEEAVIAGAVTFSIEGKLNRGFFDEDGQEENDGAEFAAWQDLKGICFQLIKGKRAPLHFKFVFHLKPEHAQAVLQKGSAALASFVRALVLTVRYDGGKAYLCTGVSYSSFTADKEAEKLWDASLQRYLLKKEISFEVL